MALATNTASMMAQTNLHRSGRAMRQSISRLSSGLRVQSAADDAAGIAVSENLRAQNSGYKQAMRNANEGVAILQVVEGAYQKTSDIIVRMRELAVQAASDGLTDTERAYLDTEFQVLGDEVTRIGEVTEYNGQSILDATGGTLTFQIGTRNTASDRLTVTPASLQSAVRGLTGLASVNTAANAQQAISFMDTSMDFLATDRASVGSAMNNLSAAADHLSVTIQNISAANSLIRDVDMAAESARFAKENVMQQAAISMLAQANQQPNLALRLLG